MAEGDTMRNSTLLSLVFIGFSASTAACGAGDTVPGGAGSTGPLEYYAPFVLPCGSAGVRVGDVDGDGTKDLITSGNGNEAAVYLNQGGAFADPVRTPVDTSYFKLFDVDGDGRIDLDTGLSIYFGQADGSFGKRVKGTLPYGETRFDVNGDGHPDILSYADSTVTAYAVDGDGATHVIYKVAGVTASPTFADLDHDGRIDIVYAVGSAVVARFGQGGASFSQARVVITADLIVEGVEAVDLEGDKVTDLVLSVGAQGSAQGYVLLRNSGAGVFSQVKVIASEPKILYRFTDATGDGRMDIVLTEAEQLAVLAGNGNGTFAAPALVTGPWSHASQNQFVDLNNDGRLDLVVADTVMSVLIHK